jgi:hypothetical protein
MVRAQRGLADATEASFGFEGFWTDGVYRTSCDACVDHTLLQPGAPDAQTLATTQWDLVYGWASSLGRT